MKEQRGEFHLFKFASERNCCGHDLITRFEQKIEATRARVWGEE